MAPHGVLCSRLRTANVLRGQKQPDFDERARVDNRRSAVIHEPTLMFHIQLDFGPCDLKEDALGGKKRSASHSMWLRLFMTYGVTDNLRCSVTMDRA